MRKCIRCDVEMIEDFDIKDAKGDKLKVTRPQTSGILPKNNFGYVKTAVCPACGYLETYLSDLRKIQQNAL